MKVSVLINADAGSVQRSPSADFVGIIRHGLESRGVEAEVSVIPGREIKTQAEALLVQAGKAENSQETALVVGGGDGTLGSVASLLAGTQMALGILPLGTLNHFARDLGLPQDLDAAMDVIAAGQVRRIDVAEVNGHVFVNNASIGVYPFIVAERTAEQHRRGVGKLAAIGPALLRTLRASSWQRVTMSADNDLREVRTACVFIGNNFYDLAALGRRKELCAGELCVYVVKQQTWLGLALLPFKIVLGLSHPERDVELFKVRRLLIQASARHLRVAADGETFKEATPLVFRIRPRSLTVLAPPSAGPRQGIESEAALGTTVPHG
jgi:diacylglycerol kinase family enzyme